MLCLQDQIYFVYKTAALCLNLINLYWRRLFTEYLRQFHWSCQPGILRFM